ncbi:crotonase, core [Purpureocillium lavendulum]|uniref:Crotonase, core n=1 Tax=Purpureocillium lavendulum TaxID=1247861 RepID=A0AB34G2X3_9HYPO|nr:crotonase, core [Purpureocillium lavendulum]
MSGSESSAAAAAAAAAGLVQATSPTDGVRLVTLNRPGKRNALSGQLIAELLGALSAASTDPGVKAVIITGNGPFFCAGADLNDIAALDSAGARSCRYLEDLCSGVAAVRKPVIAAVNGPAVASGLTGVLLGSWTLQLGGGFELALMCDLIVAAKSAYFALPETQRGLIPGAGGTQRLTAAVGKFMAMRTILLGRPIAADEALSCGLLCDLVDDGDLLQQAINVGAGLGERGPEALQFAKEAICRADGLCRDDLFERHLYYATFGTEEKRRGVDDFLAKRNKSGGSTAQPPGAPK